MSNNTMKDRLEIESNRQKKDNIIYVRVNDDVLKAIIQIQNNFDISTRSEVIRILIDEALKTYKGPNKEKKI